jgi:uncharacterized protein (DUF952 family)
MTIYKILPRQMWADATVAGVFNGSPVDLTDGYIHFSTAAQVQETASKYFSGVPDLLLIAVSAHLLGDSLKWEPSRGGALFPHLYAALPVGLAEWVKPLPLDADGKPLVPSLDSASVDRR